MKDKIARESAIKILGGGCRVCGRSAHPLIVERSTGRVRKRAFKFVCESPEKYFLLCHEEQKRYQKLVEETKKNLG